MKPRTFSATSRTNHPSCPHPLAFPWPYSFSQFLEGKTPQRSKLFTESFLRCHCKCKQFWPHMSNKGKKWGISDGESFRNSVYSKGLHSSNITITLLHSHQKSLHFGSVRIPLPRVIKSPLIRNHGCQVQSD